MDPRSTLASWACLAAIFVTLCYIALCSVSPFGKCRKCSGTGRAGRRFSRDCPRCGGTRLRVRIGRRVWTYLRREYRDGTN